MIQSCVQLTIKAVYVPYILSKYFYCIKYYLALFILFVLCFVWGPFSELTELKTPVLLYVGKRNSTFVEITRILMMHCRFISVTTESIQSVMKSYSGLRGCVKDRPM